jgi:hypothetical protein
MLAKWETRYNGTMVLGVANKIQKDWDLWRRPGGISSAKKGGSETRPYGITRVCGVRRSWMLLVVFTAEIQAGFVPRDQARDIGAMFVEDEERDGYDA